MRIEKPREFWVFDKGENVPFLCFYETPELDTEYATKVIEKSAADKLAEALEYYARKGFPRAEQALAEYRGEE